MAFLRRMCLLLFCAAMVTGSHFRGAIFMVRPSPSGYGNEMEISFHISWRRSFNSEAYCDQSVVDSGDLIEVEGDLECETGCSGTITDIGFRCTDFSEDEDWTFGERVVTHNFTSTGSGDITISFTGNAWISPFNSRWRVPTTFSLVRRNDTGEINSTPRAITSPVLRLQEGCNHTIRIPVTDPDGDIIRCRWAVSRECEGICDGFPGAVLNRDTCSLFYNANQGQGVRAAAIMIEDFLPNSTSPLSSVALQFVILVIDTMQSCSVSPIFVPPTPSDGSCVAVPSGETLRLRLAVSSGSPRDTVTEIQTVSPAGFSRSALMHDRPSGLFYIDITWMPTSQQENAVHLFCFTATTSAQLSSSQSCIQLLTGQNPPRPVQASAHPSMITNVHPSNPEFQIEFDLPIERPSIPANITFYEYNTNQIVLQISALSTGEIQFENGTKLIVKSSFMFVEETKYYIGFDRGIVVGLEGCGPGNEPVTNRDFWTFTTLDITPPVLLLQSAPRISNVNISITFNSNEQVSWSCALQSGATSVVVDCSEGSWSGYNLVEGEYRLEITGTDLANNTASTFHSFQVDTTPPLIVFTFVPGEESNRQRPTLGFRCTNGESCSYQCIFYEGNTTGGGTSSRCFRSFTTPSLSHDNTYTVVVIGTDVAGNVGEAVSYSWETDFEPPNVFGVGNISALCTDDLSPSRTGRAMAMDNRDPTPRISHHDRRLSCSITRTWRAVDRAGNTDTLLQYITLEYVLVVSFVPVVSLSCDSSEGSVSVPSNTATVPNPCRRPLQLDFQDSNPNYTCPMRFTRLWTATDGCTQETSVVQQSISLFDVCPLNSCGRSETPPQGICIQGRCVCNQPWFGEECDTLIYSVVVESIDNVVLQEFEDYTQMIRVLNGTAPLIISLVSAPSGVVFNRDSRTISWRRVQAGNHTLTVEVKNEVSSQRVSWTLAVEPGYTAVLDSIPESVFPRATSVALSGRVRYFDGNVVESLLRGFVSVTIEIRSHNGRRELKTFTQRDGTFSSVFFPAPSEYGSYTAGAKHPRAQRASDQVSWDFLGMSVTPRSVRLRDATIAAFDRMFHNVSRIINDGPRALHNITATSLIQNSEELSILIRLNGPSSLEPGEIAYISVRVISIEALQASFPVVVSSAEGTETTLFVNLFISQILPEIVVNPPSLTTRVVRGTARSLDFNVTNIGMIPANMVRAVLPSIQFLTLMNFGTSQQQNEGEFTLKSGESAILTVLVTLPPDQPLGETSGRIVISSMETFQTINFRILISSNMLMNLTVEVEDEYTYFAEGLPLLSDAVVTLTNNQRDYRERLTTDETGRVTFMNIPEDRYQLRVTGPNHVPVDQIIVTSAEELVHTVFVPRRAVTYSFTVVPTTFEETYTVTLEADFVTHVPIPVVTLEPREISLEPYELGLEDTIQYNITNHGLIRADNVTFELPTEHPFLNFSTEILDIGSLDALTSIIVPVKVTRIESVEKRNVGACIAAFLLALRVGFSYICGEIQNRKATALMRGLNQLRSECGGGSGRGRGTIRFIGTSVGGGDPSSISSAYTPTEINCDECFNSFIGCVSPSPFSCPSFFSGIGRFNPRDLADWSSAIGCIVSIHPITRPFTPLFCLPSLLRDCLGADTEFRRRRRSVGSVARQIVPYVYAMHGLTSLGTEILGDERWLTEVSDQRWVSEVFNPALSDTSDGGFLITMSEFTLITSMPPPNNATREMVASLLERFNNTFVGWSNGTLEPTFGANIVSYSSVQNFTDNINDAQNLIGDIEEGETFLNSYNDVIGQYDEILETDEEEEGVCAVVRVRIEQEIALTRDAFLAKLEIENMEMAELQRVQMEFLITDFLTGMVSTQLFVIGNETLTGSLREGDVGWLLASGASGAAEWLIVPLSEAAPTENREYDIGGAFSYISNGNNVTVPLLPTRISVAPDPSLIIHYFWEKYVIGDNPFTPQREPSIPFALGIAIHNAGYGTAMNLRITSGQPEIIENDKGLLVTFKIIGTRIGSESVTPSLTVDFGDIEATETKVARWLLICSLQGEFTNYSASFEYMNPLGDPRLSVLDELVIHDLIRNVVVYQDDEDDGVLDFLVNDFEDVFDIPDALYSSKTFTRYNVSMGDILSLSPQSSGSIEVLASSNDSGWIYFRYEAVNRVFTETKRSINFTKTVDGVVTALPPENAWVAGEAQPSSTSALDPFFLHIIDYLDKAEEVLYILNPCTTECITDEQEFEPIAPPVPPINVAVERVGPTWISVTWELVITSSGVKFQLVLVRGGGRDYNVTVNGTSGNSNITDLDSGVMYTMQIVTVAEDGQMSFPSLSALAMTQVEFDSPPDNLEVDSVGDTWIFLTWSLNPGNILIANQIISLSGGGEERNMTIEGNGTSVNVTGLQPGTEYSFKVIAISSDGQSSPPSVLLISFTAGNRDVTTPTDLLVGSSGNAWIFLMWSLEPGNVVITNQIILISGGGEERNMSLEGNGTSFNVTGLQPGTEYSFRVIAVGSGGQTSSPSVSITAITQDRQVLPTPGNLVVVNSGSTWIFLIWSLGSGNVVITNQIILISGGGEVRNMTIEGTGISFNVTGLESGTEYSFRVIAVGREGQTSAPSVSTAAITQDQQVLPTPGNFIIVGLGETWIFLMWSFSTGNVVITNQIILISGGGEERNMTIEGNGTSFNVTGLQPGTEYSFRVIAVGREGQTSVPSVSIATITQDQQVLPTPGNLIIASLGETWIFLMWSFGSGNVIITNQIILISGGGEERNMSLEGNGTSFNVTGLQSGTGYTFRVIAVDRDRQTSLPSVSITAMTQERQVVATPGDLLVSDSGDTWIFLTWSLGPTNVMIKNQIILINGGGEERNMTIEGNGTSFNVTGLQPETEYSFQVIAIGNDGQTSPPSVSITASTMRLTVIATPADLFVSSSGNTWIFLTWFLRTGNVVITNQIILISGGGEERNMTIEGNETSVNVTGLQSGTEYSFRVTAVGRGGQTSLPSASLTAMTQDIQAPIGPGTLVNDTIIGDPLFTVALPVGNEFMCYEIHGRAGKYFNLVSDTCTSVNALFSQLPSDPQLNRMSEIAIYARAISDACAQVLISLENCTGYVNGEAVISSYNQDGISVRRYRNRWRIAVPNCVSTPALIMWIFCESQPDMLRFHIARGNNLAPYSHGLLAQFWNIPIAPLEEDGQTYLILFNSTSHLYRRIPAERESLTWDRTRAPCYYVGNSQGGPEFSHDPIESVIEGSLSNYETSGSFATSFLYARFDDMLCEDATN